MSLNSNNTSLAKTVCCSTNDQQQVEFDSGFLSTSNYSSLSEVELEFKNVPKQENATGNFVHKSSNFVIEELKKKIVQLNVELSKSNQENSKLKTDAKFHKNQQDYLQHYLDWHKKKCSTFQNENSKLKNKNLQQEMELTNCQSLLRSLEWDNQNWVQKIDLIRLESTNKCKLLEGKLEILENKVKLDELYAKNAREEFVSIRNNSNLERRDAQIKIDGLENQLKISKANIQTLKNEVSEFSLKNSNLENILGKKNIEIENLQADEENLKQQNASSVEKHFFFHDVKDLRMQNAELNKMVQIKDIEIKDKVRRYETSIRTLLRKIKEYKSSTLVQIKNSDKLQVDLKNLTTQLEKLTSENVNLNTKLLISSAIASRLKKNNVKLGNDLFACKNILLRIFMDKSLSKDKRRTDLKNIHLLIEKSDNLDKNIYENDDFNKEFNVLNCLVQNMKKQILINR